jgi:hypothetical protein
VKVNSSQGCQLEVDGNDELGEGRNIFLFFSITLFKIISMASKAFFNKLKTNIFIAHARTHSPVPSRVGTYTHTQKEVWENGGGGGGMKQSSPQIPNKSSVNQSSKATIVLRLHCHTPTASTSTEFIGRIPRLVGSTVR